MTKLDSVLKSRDITFPTKIHIIKAMVFPVVTYRCEKRRLSTEELVLSSCGAGEDFSQFLGLQGDQTSQF